MLRLTNLTSTCEKLKTHSLSVATLGIQLSHSLNDELIEDILDELSSSVPEQSIVEFVKHQIMEGTEDAEQILREIDNFCEYILLGSKSFVGNSDKYPFLMQVWSGDIYDEEEIGGLNKLLSDICIQEKRLKYEKMVKMTIKHFRGHD
jgi:hypothetical protein